MCVCVCVFSQLSFELSLFSFRRWFLFANHGICNIVLCVMLKSEIDLYFSSSSVLHKPLGRPHTNCVKTSWRQHHDSDRCAAVFIISYVSTVLLSLRHVADIVSWRMPVCGLPYTLQCICVNFFRTGLLHLSLRYSDIWISEGDEDFTAAVERPTENYNEAISILPPILGA
jgi:hypothetical protein